MLRMKSSGSVTTIWLDRAAVLVALRAAAAVIREEHPEVVGIRVFGSIARGDHTGVSDADVLICVRDGTPGDFFERIRTFSPYFRLPIAVDVLVYDETQLASNLRSDPRFQQLWRESLDLLIG